MANVETVEVKEIKAAGLAVLANPAPLGLMGFGMTTVLLNLLNAGILASTAIGMVFAVGIFYGGIAQVIAGVLEARKGNTFGMVAFTSYGFFWIALVALLVFPALGWAPAVDNISMTAFMVVWGIFTAYMFIGTLKKNIALMFVFGSLTVLFALLAAHEYTGIAMIGKIAGYEGIICGLSAIYLACAEVLNETYGKHVLPIGEM